MAIDWRPAIGDPTWLGWLTCLGYGLAVITCARRSFLERRNTPKGDESVIWFCLATVMLLLGINKQLDLQTLVIQVLRNLAGEEGWYDRRRVVQTVAVAIVAGSTIVFFAVVTKSLSCFIRRHLLVWVGCLLILSYVILRMANINHVIDDSYGGSSWLSALELGGLICLLADGCWGTRPTKTSRTNLSIED